MRCSFFSLVRALFLLSLLPGCGAGGSPDPQAAVDPPEPADQHDVDRLQARLDTIDAALSEVRGRLAAAEVEGDVSSQRAAVQEAIVVTLSEGVRAIDDRLEAVDDMASTAFAAAGWTEDTVLDHQAQLSAVHAHVAADGLRLGALEGLRAGLRPVALDSAACGLATDDGGVIYRVAPDLLPGELLLRDVDGSGLRVESPVAVTCGVTSVGPDGDLADAPPAVTWGGAVYLLPEHGAWFRVGV